MRVTIAVDIDVSGVESDTIRPSEREVADAVRDAVANELAAGQNHGFHHALEDDLALAVVAVRIVP